jgi:hypothetical protein
MKYLMTICIKKKIWWIIALGLLLLSYFVFSSFIWHSTNAVPSVAIDESLDEELGIQIQRIINIRNKAVIDKDTDTIDSFYDKSYLYGLWAYEHEIKKMKYLHGWAEKQSVIFKNAESVVTIKWIREKDEGGYILDMMVTTEYEYVYMDQPNKRNNFRVGTYHSLDIIYKDNAWLITKDWYTDTLESSINLDKIDNQTKDLILSSKSNDISNLTKKRIAALEYADKYCGAASLPKYGYKYNPDYYDFNHLGGDCANFASQILHEAGGFKKTRTWNYSGNHGSKAWVNAQSFKNYLLNSGRGNLISSGFYKKVLPLSYKLLPGDIIAYGTSKEVKHVSVVTGVDSKGYTLVNCHNSDRYRVPWDLGWSGNSTKFWLIRINY